MKIIPGLCMCQWLSLIWSINQENLHYVEFRSRELNQICLCHGCMALS